MNESENIALQGGASRSTRCATTPSRPASPSTRNGRPWFAESDPGNPGWRIATRQTASDYAEYLVTPCAPVSPCSGSFTGTGITDVAVAQDGSIWFTNQLRNEVGRLDLDGGPSRTTACRRSTAASPAARRARSRRAPDGTLWVAQYGGSGPERERDRQARARDRDPAEPDRDGLPPRQPASTRSRSRRTRAGTSGSRSGPTPCPARSAGWPASSGRAAAVAAVAARRRRSGGRVVRPVSVGIAKSGQPGADGDSVNVDQICVGPPRTDARSSTSSPRTST